MVVIGLPLAGLIEAYVLPEADGQNLPSMNAWVRNWSLATAAWMPLGLRVKFMAGV